MPLLPTAMPHHHGHHQYYNFSCTHLAAPSPSLEDSPTQGLWSSLTHLPSSPHMSQLRSFHCFRSFHGHLAADTADSPDSSCHGELDCPVASSSSSSSAIQVAASRHHRDREQETHDRAYMRHQSAPVDVVPPCKWRSYREGRGKQVGNGQRRRSCKEEAGEAMTSREEDEEEDEEEEEEEGGEEQAAQEEERLPPHEELAREREAATSCGGAAFSLCQGVGRTLKGRDLCRVRNAILKQTGFIS